jgi:hypothetical protein
VAALVCVALGASTGRAQAQKIPAAEYRARVERAVVLLDALAVLERETLAAAAGAMWARAGAAEVLPAERVRALREVRALVPQTARVAAEGGGEIEVDNRWTHFQLGRYEAQPDDGDDGVRAEDLEAVAGRLRALAARLAEAEELPYAARDKEAEKGRLAAILRGPEFSARDARGGALERLAERIAEEFEKAARWVRDLFPGFGPVQAGPATNLTRVAQVVIFAVAALLIAFAVWKYWGARGERVKKPKRRARVVLGEHLDADQTAADILADAERLAREGNLRGAIRKAYVALLCELGDRRLVTLARHKTNRDYLSSVRESAPRAYALFRPLTLDFERHWYGLEDATEDDWRSFESACRSALKAE